MSRRRLLLVAALLLVLLPLLLLGWLLGTGSGRDLSVAQLLARLPDDALSIGSSEGRLAGPLVLNDVRYRAEGVEVSARRVVLEYGLPALIARRLRIQSARVDGLEVALPPAPTEPEPVRIVLPERLPWPSLRLPISVDVDALRINGARVRRGDESVLDLVSLDLAGQLSRDGALQVDMLEARADQGTLRASGGLGLAGEPSGDFSAVWAPAGEGDATATLRLRNVGEGVEVSLGLAAAGGAALVIDRAMAWRLQVDLDGFDPSRWGLGEASQALSLRLAGQGDRSGAALAGRVSDGARALAFEDARLRWVDEGGAVQLDALRLALDSGGAVDVTGTVAFADGLALDLAALIEALPLPIGDGEPALFDGQLQLRGPLSALSLELASGELRRAGLSAQTRFTGELQSGGLRIDAAGLESAGSSVGVAGRLDWDPVLRADLALELNDFDPAIFSDELPGRIDGALRLTGDLDPERPDWRLDIERLGGEFRQHALSGRGHLTWRGDGGEADLDLQLGGSRIRLQGSPGEQLDLAVNLSPLLLGDLLPDAAGRLSGDLRLRGSPETARVSGALEGSDLAFAGVELAELSLDVDGALGGPEAGRLTLEGRGLVLGESGFDTFKLQLSGTRAAHQLALAASGERLSIDAQASGAAQGEDWRGSLGTLDLQPGAAPAWRLRAPASLAWVQGAATMVDACLVGEGDSEVCIDLAGDGAVQTLAARLRGLELQTLVALAGAEGLATSGVIEGELQLARRGEAPIEGSAALRLPAGQLSESGTPDRALLRWRDLVLGLELTASTAELRVSGVLDEEGRIEGALSGGSPLADADASLSGRLRVDLPGLAALDVILPELADTRGALRAELALSGRWREPVIEGSVELQGLGAEVPALGIRLRDTLLVLRSDGSRVEVDGLIDSGEGKLRLDGALDDAFGEARRGRLQLRGERVRVADTPFVRALVSPDLTLTWRNRRLQVAGRLAVPEAALDLAHLDGTVSTSADVVVIDPREDYRAGGSLPLTARVEVELGNKVTLKGFGFDGGVSGTLQINERSGRATTGRGSLEVRGSYTAYGQDLEIQRGRLLFAASPLDDPGLDVRAQREVGTTKVGIQVSGTAQRPLLSVWSDPVLDEAEALSYLVLGRPLRSATSAEGAELGQAAAAIGGNFLAGRVGERMGFDTFGVADSQALGGAAFTVGKYLSPALYLSYGISLFGSGQVITLRYLLTEHLDVEVETGSESRAGINYSIER